MKKNVWIFNHYGCTPKTGSLLRHFTFAKMLNECGYSSKVFASNQLHYKKSTFDVDGKLYKIYDEEGPEFIFIDTPKYDDNGKKRVINMLSYFFKLFPVTKKYVKQANEKPDVILASSVHPLTCVAGIFIARRYKVPCIVEIRDLWPESIFAYSKRVTESSVFGRLLISGEKWIYKKADRIIFTKEGDVDYIYEKKWDLESGGCIDTKKCYYINNGIDVENFNLLTKTTDLDDNLSSNKFNVIYTGAIRPVNDVEKLIDVAKILSKYEDIEVLIYGTGNMIDTISKRIFDEKLSNIKLKGHVEKSKIPYILSKSSVNLLHYSQENYNWSRGNSSNKLFEYMASGVPIVSTVKMGYCIISKYDCGIVSDSNSAEDIAKAICDVRNSDKYEEYQKNAINGAKDFDFKVLTQKLIDIIENT